MERVNKTQQERFFLRIESRVQQYLRTYNKKPKFLFVGEKQLDQLEMCDGLFNPTGTHILATDLPHDLELVIVARDTFMQLK